MPKYEIWSEGFAATGQSGKATFMGEQEAVDFKTACRTFFESKRDRYYNPETNSYWGCKLFPTQAEAAKSFG